MSNRSNKLVKKIGHIITEELEEIKTGLNDVLRY
jgi:hypothetical protein